MRKIEREELIKKAEESSLWILELRLGKQNIKLSDLAGQGVLSDDKKWRQLVLKRNIYRKILIKKLRQFFKGELKDESNPTYEDYVHSNNYNKYGEEDTP